jgi:NADH-quinone oxidoreductase subunit N
MIALQLVHQVAQVNHEATLATPRVVWSGLIPQLILMAGGVVMLTIVSIFKGRLPRGSYAIYTVAVAGAAIIATIPLWHRVLHAKEGPASLLGGAVALDGSSLFLIGVICIGLILAALLADGYLRREGIEGPELYVLMLLSASGGTIMASANDLIVLFIGLEILSISAYILAAMHSRRITSQEAGMKYFVLGAFASAFLLYGIALIYGATGSTNLAEIQSFLANHIVLHDGTLLAGIALLLVGLGFKVAAAPFHAWTPDVYQGSPTPVTAFMASAVKAAGFAGIIRVITLTLATYRLEWRPIVFGLAALSLLVGAFSAIVQSNVKRMLAYSSINHAGFILVGIQAGGRGTSAVLFYLAAYTFMVGGSFGVATVVGGRGDGRHGLDEYKGLSKRRPALAAAFTIFLLAQAGVPFTAGFFAKLGVLRAAANTHDWSLAIIAMLTAIVSVFMYLRIVSSMYFAEPDEASDKPIHVAIGARVALTIAVVGTIALGVVPGPFTRLAEDAKPVLVAAVRSSS